MWLSKRSLPICFIVHKVSLEGYTRKIHKISLPMGRPQPGSWETGVGGKIFCWF